MRWDDHETCRRCGSRDCVGGVVCAERVEARRKAFRAHVEDSQKPATLAYGSDNAGGVHLCLGEARVHLTHTETLNLARGLEAEASLPPSPLKGIVR